MRERAERSGQLGEVRARCSTLSGFIREAWDVLEPEQPFVWGWVLDAMAEHLQAVTDGDILRLLMNVPPGFMKSLMTGVFWPAFEWGPLGRPALRYLGGAFEVTNAERDSKRMRDLVSSDWYQDLWPDVVIRGKGTDKNWTNSRTGWRQARPMRSFTGKRADRIICFPGDEVVMTSAGPEPIGTIVRGRLPRIVWSTDTRTGATMLKPVTGWHRNPASAIVEVRLSDGASFRCTPCHRIWTRRGWVEAGLLLASDVLPCGPVLDAPDHGAMDAEAGREIPLGVARGPDGQHLRDREFYRPGFHPEVGVLRQPVPFGGRSPCLAAPDLVDDRHIDLVPGSQRGGAIITLRDLDRLATQQNGSGTVFHDGEGAVGLGVFNVLRPRSVGEVIQSRIEGVTVQVSDFHPLWGRADKRQHDALMVPERSGVPIPGGVEARISARTDAGLENTGSDSQHRPVLAPALPSLGANPSEVADAVEAFPSRDRSPLFVETVGHCAETFCITVADTHTFYVGSVNPVLVANCDDPHSVEGGESDAERKRTLRVMRETVPTRLNNPKKSAIIVIMQRIHVADVSGMILDEGLEYTHLMLPMHFDPSRKCVSYNRHHEPMFEDPRLYEGELLFPERFDAESVDRTAKEMTAYAVSGQMEQSPVPRDGGLFKRSWFEIVDEIPAGGTECRAWDLAGSKKKAEASSDPDWTVGLKGKRMAGEGTFYVTDMIRMRDSPGKVAAAIRNTASQDGYGTTISLAQDPGQAGKFQIEFLVSLLAGYAIDSETVHGDKQLRASPAATQAEFGKIKIVKGPWNADFFAEVCNFPGGKHDDIVDALSDLIRVLSSLTIYDLSGVS